MIPENQPSSVAVPSIFAEPDDLVTTSKIDYERGAAALGDPSGGFDQKTWRCYVNANNLDVMVQADNETPIVIFQQAAIEEISFAFDQSMRPAVGYTLTNVRGAYLRWFDTTVNIYVTTFYPDLRNPRLTLDDKRPTQVGVNSDIIFGYIRGDSVYYRMQRDRFQVEYFWRDGVQPNIRLKNIGLARNLRLQFELV